MNKVVYFWCDGDIPFYVGKGNIDRPHSWKNRNKRIIHKRKYCEKMGTFNIFIVSSGLSNEYACYLEKIIIKNCPEFYNYTFGGEGGDTFSKLTSEQKERKRKLLSIASSNRKPVLVEIGRKLGKYVVENKLGVHGSSAKELSEWGSIGGKIGGKKSKELGLGIHSLTKEQRIENSRNAGKIGGKNTSSQKWICLETGHISNSGALTNYQRKRGIDTTLRKRIT